MKGLDCLSKELCCCPIVLKSFFFARTGSHVFVYWIYRDNYQYKLILRDLVFR